MPALHPSAKPLRKSRAPAAHAAKASARSRSTPASAGRSAPKARTRKAQPLRSPEPALPALAKPAARKADLWSVVRARKVIVATSMAAIVIASAVAAALTLRMDASVSSSAVASPVVFQSGTDYATINAAGFATLTVGSSGTSASLSLSGVAGAAQVSLGDVMKISNQGTSTGYVVTLTRSTSLPTSVSSFVVTVEDATSTLASWDAKTATGSTSFTVPAGTSLDISIALVVADGTAVGPLGSFAIQASMTPA